MGTFRTTLSTLLSPGLATLVARIRSPTIADRTTTATLVINQAHIALHDAVDTGALIDELVRAVRTGGAVVHVVARDEVEYDIVVTTATHAFIRYQPMVTDVHAADGPWISFVDLDY